MPLIFVSTNSIHPNIHLESMAPYTGVELIYGGAPFGFPGGFYDSQDDRITKTYEILNAHGVNKIDVAQIYGDSEDSVGRTGAGSKYGLQIDTKWGGGFLPILFGVSIPDSPDEVKKMILDAARASVARLAVDQIDVFYVHAPPKDVALEVVLEGINDAHREGLFRRFGLSNYRAADVQRAHDVARANGWLTPTVYQGSYSPIARKLEDELIPVLRKLGIAFYAYSPTSGGFLAKTRAQVEAKEGRFNPQHVANKFAKAYEKEALLRALDRWWEIAAEEGVSGYELAMRWMAFHSALDKEHGDGLMLGGQDHVQLQNSFEVLERGPLSDRAVRRMEEVREIAGDEAPTEDYEKMVKLGS